MGVVVAGNSNNGVLLMLMTTRIGGVAPPPPPPPAWCRRVLPSLRRAFNFSTSTSTSNSRAAGVLTISPLSPPPPSTTATFTATAVSPSPSDLLTATAPAPHPPATSTSAWSEFSKNISGEWDGFGADFTTDGKPIELPESVVPQAYREWEVKVFDWQTQCPTLAQPEELSMAYKTIKLLPTVGCEADAATWYSILERTIAHGTSDTTPVSAFAYHSGGSYVAVWPISDNASSIQRFELEHCLINPQDQESRVRIIQVICVGNAGLMLESIMVFCEQWYGPFRNGDQLGGCAIRDSAFASTAPIKASQMIGIWEGPSAVAKFGTSQTNKFQELVDGGIQKAVRDEGNLVLLPKQMWCSLGGSKNGETCCEVGWLIDHGSGITSRCNFTGEAKLKGISISRETAILEGA